PMSSYEKVDVQLLPEGGNLISEEKNTVAFKVTNFFGDPVDVSGKLVDEEGNEISQVQSFYGGMGKFELTPNQGKEYTFMTDQPFETKTTLPSSINALSLGLINSGRDTLEFRVIGQAPIDQIMYVAGVLNNVQYTSIELSPEAPLIKVPVADYPQGIAQFTLFVGDQPAAERLVYVNRHKTLNVETSLDKAQWAPKSEMSFEVQVTNNDGVPIKGNFSIAVADDYFAKIGGQYHTSMSAQMLLTSELKGKIPTPNYYFSSLSSYTTTALDLLMMTSGWRRYSWEYIFSDRVNEENAETQTDQVIATVLDKKGNTVPNIDVQIVNTTNFSADVATSDANGTFVLAPHQVTQLENIYFKTPSDAMEVNIAKASGFVSSNLNNANPWESYYQAKITPPTTEYFGDDYEILDGLTVNSTRIVEPVAKDEKYELVNLMSVKSHYFVETRTTDQLFTDVPLFTTASQQQGGFVDLVKQVTNIYSYNGMTGQLLLRPPSSMQFPGRWGSVVVLNGSLMGKDFRVLDNLRPDNIDKIEVIKTSAMAIYYGSIASNGAVLVTTKKGELDGAQKIVQPERVTLKINKEFYSPKYDSNGALEGGALSDYRKTIHWVPSFNTDDFGKATINYFNDQASKTVTIIIQGTDGRGNMAYYMDQYALSPE
ncbi:MAG: hypothetical protein AAGC88_15095, partial [Bacteroidota bacterium]